MTNFILKYIENANTNIEAKIEQQEYVQQKLFIMTQTIKTSDFNIKYAIAYLTPYDQQLVKQKLITKLTPYFKEYFTKYGCVEEVSERIAEWLMNQESQSDKPKLIASNFANFFNDKKL
ncbi:repeat-containing B domain protein, partial [Orientia tsutsugamushi str. Gilliam]